jgi:hypothetical protein
MSSSSSSCTILFFLCASTEDKVSNLLYLHTFFDFRIFASSFLSSLYSVRSAWVNCRILRHTVRGSF